MPRTCRPSESTQTDARPLRVLLDGRCPSNPGAEARRFFQTTASLLESGTFPHQVTLVSPNEAGGDLPTGPFDVVHSLGLQAKAQSPGRSLLSVHDVHALCDSSGKAFKERALREAGGLVCPTQAAKDLILSRFKIENTKVHVVPPTPSPLFFPREPALCQAILPGLRLRQRFLLAVGGLQDKRSPRATLRAAQILKWLGLDMDIVFVGQDAPSFDLESVAWEYDVGASFVSLGFVGREVLAALYSSAFAVVFPCRNETSCLPILEAFASATPVVTNATRASLEVGGQAAMYADPDAEPGLGLAMHLEWLAENPFLVRQHVERGRRRLKSLFSPAHTLSALARAYEGTCPR